MRTRIRRGLGMTLCAFVAAAWLLAVPTLADGGAAPGGCGKPSATGADLEAFYVGTLHLGFAAARASCFPSGAVLPQEVAQMIQTDLASARDGSRALCACVAMDPAEFDRVAAAVPGRTAGEVYSWLVTLYQRYQAAVRNSRCACSGGPGYPPPFPTTTPAPTTPPGSGTCDQCAAQKCPSCAGVVVLMCEVMDGHPNSQACRDCIRQNCLGGGTTTPPQGGESQTLTVPNTQAVKVRTSFSTVQGGVYRIQASGVINDWGNAPDGIDAVWCYAEWRCGREGQVWNQLRINGKGITDLLGQAVPYNPAHVYTLDVTGNGQPIEFFCLDAQDSAGDNVGAFTVTVTRVR